MKRSQTMTSNTKANKIRRLRKHLLRENADGVQCQINDSVATKRLESLGEKIS